MTIQGCLGLSGDHLDRIGVVSGSSGAGLGEAWPTSAQLGPAWPGLARLGSAPARPDQAWLGSARLGCVPDPRIPKQAQTDPPRRTPKTIKNEDTSQLKVSFLTFGPVGKKLTVRRFGPVGKKLTVWGRLGTVWGCLGPSGAVSKSSGLGLAKLGLPSTGRQMFYQIVESEKRRMIYTFSPLDNFRSQFEVFPQKSGGERSRIGRSHI